MSIRILERKTFERKARKVAKEISDNSIAEDLSHSQREDKDEEFRETMKKALSLKVQTPLDKLFYNKCNFHMYLAQMETEIQRYYLENALLYALKTPEYIESCTLESIGDEIWNITGWIDARRDYNFWLGFPKRRREAMREWHNLSDAAKDELWADMFDLAQHFYVVDKREQLAKKWGNCLYYKKHGKHNEATIGMEFSKGEIKAMKVLIAATAKELSMRKRFKEKWANDVEQRRIDNAERERNRKKR